MSKNKYVNLQLKYCTLLPNFVCLNTWSLFLDILLCALLISRPSQLTVTCSSAKHTDCIVVFPLLYWLRERATMLRDAFITHPVTFPLCISQAGIVSADKGCIISALCLLVVGPNHISVNSAAVFSVHSAEAACSYETSVLTYNTALCQHREYYSLTTPRFVTSIHIYNSDCQHDVTFQTAGTEDSRVSFHYIPLVVQWWYVLQGCTNLGLQLTVATYLCLWKRLTCGFHVRELLYVTLLEPRILCWLLGIWEICAASV